MGSTRGEAGYWAAKPGLTARKEGLSAWRPGPTGREAGWWRRGEDLWAANMVHRAAKVVLSAANRSHRAANPGCCGAKVDL